MREIVHLQAGQCGNQIGSKVLLSNHYIEVEKRFRMYVAKILRGEDKMDVYHEYHAYSYYELYEQFVKVFHYYTCVFNGKLWF